MSIGWPQTFALDLDQVQRALALYAQTSRLSVTQIASELGLGGPKVEGINSWMKYLGLRNPRSGQLTPLGELLARADARLVDKATLCVLHYVLVSNPEATVWHETVNNFMSQRDFFSADDLRAHFDQPQFATSSEKQLRSDRRLFLTTYTGAERRALQALGLLEVRDGGYAIQQIRDVPALVLGYCLYERRSHLNYETTTETRRLLYEIGSPGLILRMSEESLRYGLAELESASLVSIARIADIDGVSYVNQVNSLELLERYYRSR